MDGDVFRLANLGETSALLVMYDGETRLLDDAFMFSARAMDRNPGDVGAMRAKAAPATL